MDQPKLNGVAIGVANRTVIADQQTRETPEAETGQGVGLPFHSPFWDV